MRIAGNTIWMIGLAIFLAAMLILSNIFLALFAPILGMFGAFAIIAVLIMAFLGVWVMRKGTKAT